MRDKKHERKSSEVVILEGKFWDPDKIIKIFRFSFEVVFAFGIFGNGRIWKVNTKNKFMETEKNLMYTFADDFDVWYTLPIYMRNFEGKQDNITPFWLWQNDVIFRLFNFRIKDRFNNVVLFLAEFI